MLLVEDDDDDGVEGVDQDEEEEGEAYACENCGAEFDVLEEAEKHEAICMRND